MEMPEALAKTGTPVAAPPHPPKVIGRRQHKKNIEQNVIKCAHSKSRSFTASLSRNQPPDAKKMFQAGDFFNGEGKSTGQPAKLAAGRVARN
jgi:hypothetical protein